MPIVRVADVMSFGQVCNKKNSKCLLDTKVVKLVRTEMLVNIYLFLVAKDKFEIDLFKIATGFIKKN